MVVVVEVSVVRLGYVVVVVGEDDDDDEELVERATATTTAAATPKAPMTRPFLERPPLGGSTISR